METSIVSDLVGLVPQAALAILFALFVLYWNKEQQRRDDVHLEQYKCLVERLEGVIQANTEALAGLKLVEEIRKEIDRRDRR